jgi:hypothetical protein
MFWSMRVGLRRHYMPMPAACLQPTTALVLRCTSAARSSANGLLLYNRPRTGLALADLIAEAQTFDAHFAILDETAARTANLLTLLPQASGGRVHDVNIVATMRAGRVQRLLTNNPSDFAAFSHLITVLPLV